ncbi:MAG: WD40 repeat domain-containing protein [Planctomycetes bacterium]|nr:WD40 repeat domain-containing protein [Planctomycetota bacterium]
MKNLLRYFVLVSLFLFVSCGTMENPEIRESKDDEEKAYKNVINGSSQDCETYLKKYPKGKHTDKIKTRFLSLPIQTLKEYCNFVKSVSFSPDGRILASGSCEDTIKLWNVSKLPTVKALHTIKGHTWGVNSISFSPDGKLLASGSVKRLSEYEDRPWVWEGEIKLWNLRDLDNVKEICVLCGHKKAVQSVCFSPDGKLLASCSQETIILWDLIDVHNVKKVCVLSESENSANSVCFSPDGKTLASSSASGIKLWDINDMNNLKEPRRFCVNNLFRCVCFSPDGKILASGSYRGIHLWDISDINEVKVPFTLDQNRDVYSAVYSVSFSPDGKILASASGRNTGKEDNDGDTIYEGEIKFWDVSDIRSVKELRTLKGHSSCVVSVCFSPDGKILASGSWDKTIKLWAMDKYLDEVLNSKDKSE